MLDNVNPTPVTGVTYTGTCDCGRTLSRTMRRRWDEDGVEDFFGIECRSCDGWALATPIYEHRLT